MNTHLIIFAVAFLVVAFLFIRKSYIDDVKKARRDNFKPYDLLSLTNGEIVTLIMWSDKDFICQLTDDTTEHKPWKLLKENITYKKRSIIIDCERNFKRLNITLPFYAKKINTPQDTVSNILKRITNKPETVLAQTDVNNTDTLDKLSEDELEELKIELEEAGDYEKLATLRDYMILRQTQKKGSQ